MSIQPTILVSFVQSKVISVKEFFNIDPRGYSENPKKLIYEAAINNKETGSSTMVVVTIQQKNKKLRTAMIGDSGYMLLRQVEENGRKLYQNIYKSKEQQHSFNFPFQIGTNGDAPDKSIANKHDIKKKDIVVLGTDGLFDNVYPEDLEKLVNNVVKDDKYDSAELAKAIAEEAFRLSLDTVNMSPFGQNARNAGMRFDGGKSDDITVVVGRIEE